MARVEAEEAEGESYFASISDLMVGVLFVFLLMLTVFALNFRQAEDDQKVEYRKYEEQRKEADKQKTEAEKQKAKNAVLREVLARAVKQMQQDIADREQARIRLLHRLDERLDAQGVKVTLDENTGVLRLPESLLFEKGQAKLGAGGTPVGLQAAEAALSAISDALADVLPCFTANGSGKNCEARDRSTLEGVLIEGHSDKLAYTALTKEDSRDRNDRLSVERALTVFKEILKRNDLDKLTNANKFPLLAVSAYGDRRPAEPGETPEILQKNRRIDLRFLMSIRPSVELQSLIDQINSVSKDAP